MAEIYVYAADATNLGSIGLCGRLMPTSCEFEDVANGLSNITLTHPIDQWGKFRYLQPDRILSVEVPVRNTPEIENGDYVVNVETWTVLSTATRSERTIYNSKTGDKALKLVNSGEKVIVVKAPVVGDRYKVKYKKWAGWMDKIALEKTSETVIPDTPGGIERVAPSWKVKPQYFRIESVDVSDKDGVTVHAKHIFYDLLFNLTDYKTTVTYMLQEALDGMLEQCVAAHDFSAETNITGTHVGFNARDLDPVTAVLDPTSGLCAEWDAQLVRDNYDFFLLDKAGFDRGTTIEYAKNLAGVTMTTDISNLCTSIRPVGEDKDGKPLYLDPEDYPDGCVNSPLINEYAFRRTMRLLVNEAKVDGEDIKKSDARRMMLDAAEKQYSVYKIDEPVVEASIDFASLGDDERYTQYRELDNVYLYDIITVRHEELGIDISSEVVRIVYDCLHDTLKTVELGSLQKLIPSVMGWQLAGGISGSKIINGSIRSGALSDNAVIGRNIDVADFFSSQAAIDALNAVDFHDNVSIQEMIADSGGGN